MPRGVRAVYVFESLFGDGGNIMLTKCANPHCSVSSWENARFFRFHRQPEPNQPPANPHSVEHFWLCKTCSQLYTLEYLKKRGVVIRPRLGQRQLLQFARVVNGAISSE